MLTHIPSVGDRDTTLNLPLPGLSETFVNSRIEAAAHRHLLESASPGMMSNLPHVCALAAQGRRLLCRHCRGRRRRTLDGPWESGLGSVHRGKTQGDAGPEEPRGSVCSAASRSDRESPPRRGAVSADGGSCRGRSCWLRG